MKSEQADPGLSDALKKKGVLVSLHFRGFATENSGTALCRVVPYLVQRFLMNPFNWFSRPAWQARDAARRSAAVATGRDEMLVAALPLILRQDPDASVRRAALERIDDLTLVADRMSNDADPSLRERARARFSDLLVGKAPLAERTRALKLIDDQTQLEAVAKRAPEVGMRRAALERCTRAGFLAERCLDEADADLKQWLLTRIDAKPTLERIAEKARTKDKRLYKAVRERLDGERLAAGEGSALATRAEALCAAIEAQLRQPKADALALVATIESEWASLRPRIDERFDRRFAGAIETLKAALGAISRIGEPEPEPAAVEPEADAASLDNTPASAVAVPAMAAAEPAAPRTEADETLVALLDEAEILDPRAPRHVRDDLERRWRLHWTAERARPDADLPLQQGFTARLESLRGADAEIAASNERQRAVGEAALTELANAVEAGQLMAARSARARARTALEAMSGDAGRSVRKQLTELEPRLDKLAQWQRWSDNKVRLRLCEEVEGLAGKGLHPDALASRIAELKQAWQKLDDSEQDPGATSPDVRGKGDSVRGNSDSGLGRRFRYLCHQTLEPAKPFFEKRREIRGKRSEELNEFLERARTEMVAEGATTAALIALKRESAERLRRVDEVDPKLRGESGRQIKQLIDALNQAVDARFATISDDKQKLIAQLRRQITHAELDAALELAKNAQRRWQALPKGTAKSDQALWQEFRAVIDPLFAQKLAAGNAEVAERDAERLASQALVDEVTALGDNETLDAAQVEAELVRCESSWGADPKRPREFERSFDAAVTKVRQIAARRREAQNHARNNRVREIAQQLDVLEGRWLAGEDTLGELDASNLDGIEAQAQSALKERVARLRGAFAAPQDEVQLASQAHAARRLLLEYEFLAGVDSPPSERQARLNLQVEKLSARMSSGQSRTSSEERAALDLRWWATGPLNAADREALNARRERALASLDTR